jgi:ferredoxin
VLRVGKRIGGRAQRLIREKSTRQPEPPAGPVQVIFERAGADGTTTTGQALGGISLLAAARQLDVRIDHFCGGQCSCGTCRVELIDGAHNLSKPDGLEAMVLGSANLGAGNRLACQARLLGPVRVRVPEWF